MTKIASSIVLGLGLGFVFFVFLHIFMAISVSLIIKDTQMAFEENNEKLWLFTSKANETFFTYVPPFLLFSCTYLRQQNVALLSVNSLLWNSLKKTPNIFMLKNNLFDVSLQPRNFVCSNESCARESWAELCVKCLWHTFNYLSKMYFARQPKTCELRTCSKTLISRSLISSRSQQTSESRLQSGAQGTLLMHVPAWLQM